MKYHLTSSNDNEINELTIHFRNNWDYGPNGAYYGVVVINQIIRSILKNSSFTVMEAIKWFCKENSDLVGLTISKLKSYLDYENRISLQ